MFGPGARLRRVYQIRDLDLVRVSLDHVIRAGSRALRWITESNGKRRLCNAYNIVTRNKLDHPSLIM
jgi:hypothetical protein